MASPLPQVIHNSDDTAPSVESGLAALDFQTRCSTAAHVATEPPPAKYAVRWAREHQPFVGTGVWFMCQPCLDHGVGAMERGGIPIMWRVVAVLS